MIAVSRPQPLSAWRPPRTWHAWLAAAALAFGLLHLAWLAVGQEFTGNALLLDDLGYLPSGVAWVGLAWAASRRADLSPRAGRAWRLLALAGLACGLLGLAAGALGLRRR